MRMRTMTAALTLATILFWGRSTSTAELTLSVSGIRSDLGRVMIAVFDHAAAFQAREGAVATIRIRAQEGDLSLTLGNLPPGRYAVAAFHDENGDGRLDANLLGIPTEGHGFSKDAVGMMGPPSFADAALAVEGDRGELPIRLIYQ